MTGTVFVFRDGRYHAETRELSALSPLPERPEFTAVPVTDAPLPAEEAVELDWCDGCHRRVVNTSGLCLACETETNEDREFWR